MKQHPFWRDYITSYEVNPLICMLLGQNRGTGYNSKSFSIFLLCTCVCLQDSDLHTLCFIERRAAEGVGDEGGTGQRVHAVKLHAVGHPGLSWLQTSNNKKLCLFVSLFHSLSVDTLGYERLYENINIKEDWIISVKCILQNRNNFTQNLSPSILDKGRGCSPRLVITCPVPSNERLRKSAILYCIIL